MENTAAVATSTIQGVTPAGKPRKREYAKRAESIEVMQFIASRDGATRLAIQKAFPHRSRTGVNTTLRNLMRNKFIAVQDMLMDDSYVTVFRVNTRGRHEFDLKSGSKSKAPLATHNHVVATAPTPKVADSVQETVASPRLLESAGVRVSRVISISGVTGHSEPLMLSMLQARALHALLGEIVIGQAQGKE